MPVKRPTWHRIYYLLAAFDIVAVSVSLYVNHQIVQIYTESVAADRTWVEIGHAASEIGQLAASINAPGNDVFQSRDIPKESARLNRAYREFKGRLADLMHSFAPRQHTEQFRSMLEDLRTVRSATGQMVRDAKLTFAFLQANKLDRAARHMASMDQRFATVTSTLVRLRARIAAVQKSQFHEKTTAAALLQKFEYVIVGIITLMIVGATAYGRVIARQVSLISRLKENYRTELEERVTERTADLQAANEARADLLKQLISAEEEERRRIALDLHDGVGQSLTYLVVALHRLESVNSINVPEDAAQMRDIASKALEETRRIARGLRPSVLDDVGLVPAVERLLSDFRATQSTVVNLDNEIPAQPRFPETIETAIYRIVQEALTNIAKHSDASHATISLRQHGRNVRLLIQDDGKGFGVAAACESADSGRSVGLSSIRERVSILGGTMHIESQPEGGTTVQISLPIALMELPPDATTVDGEETEVDVQVHRTRT